MKQENLQSTERPEPRVPTISSPSAFSNVVMVGNGGSRLERKLKELLEKRTTNENSTIA